MIPQLRIKWTNLYGNLTLIIFFLGDAFEYTLTPIFKDIPDRFQCHLKQKKPRILYKLWFYISVVDPNITFETPRIHHTVYSDQIGKGG